MQETWYVLEDGNVADPNDVTPTVNDRLIHKSGVMVAMRGQVPSTRGVDPAAARATASTEAAQANRGYKTRESKAR